MAAAAAVISRRSCGEFVAAVAAALVDHVLHAVNKW